MRCFHGTTQERSEKIRSEGFHLKTFDVLSDTKTHMPGDIGAGIYAFVCSKAEKNALKFAKKKAKPPYKKNVALITFSLSSERDLFIVDLDDKDWSEMLIDFREGLPLESIEKKARADYGHRAVTLDGYVIEHFIHHIQEVLKEAIEESGNINLSQTVDVVRASSYTKFEQTSQYQASKFPNGIEICIRNKSLIKEMKFLNITDLEYKGDENNDFNERITQRIHHVTSTFGKRISQKS